MHDALSAAWLGADHEARHTAAGMIRLWGGEPCAHRKKVDSRLLSNFEPEGATGTRAAHQVITHHGGPAGIRTQSWCGMALHREMRPDRVAAQRRVGESRRASCSGQSRRIASMLRADRFGIAKGQEGGG